jgi:hypothetical protein
MHLFIYNPYSIVNERIWSRRPALNPQSRILAMERFTAGARGSLSHFAADGGADRARTDDPLLAKQVLSQLSYSPGS